MFVPLTQLFIEALTQLTVPGVDGNMGANAGMSHYPKIGLFQNNYVPTVTTVIGDLTVADYSGYLIKQLGNGWNTPTVNSDYICQSTQPDLFHFAPNATTITNTIYGYYLLDNLGNLVGAERFASPIPLLGPTNAIDLTLTLVCGVNGLNIIASLISY